MHNAVSAYARTQKQTANPRELEAQLLLRSAARIQAVIDGNVTDPDDIVEALNYNRRLWTILLAAVTEPENPLPHEIKQNFANLAIFVVSHSRALELKPEVGRMPILVNFCREIAQGLRGSETSDAA